MASAALGSASGSSSRALAKLVEALGLCLEVIVNCDGKEDDFLHTSV